MILGHQSQNDQWILSIHLRYNTICKHKNGVKHLINGKDDEDQHRIGGKELEIPPKGLPFLKLFEIIGKFCYNSY